VVVRVTAAKRKLWTNRVGILLSFTPFFFSFFLDGKLFLYPHRSSLSLSPYNPIRAISLRSHRLFHVHAFSSLNTIAFLFLNFAG